MAMNVGPPSPPRPPETVRAIRAAMQRAALAPASAAGQAATFLQILLAAGLASAWLDNWMVLIVTAVALGVGIAVGLATPIGKYFLNLSGVIVAFCVLFVVFILNAYSDARFVGDQAGLVFLGVALVPIGLDWRWVPRLRARTVCSGLVVVALIGAHEPWAAAGAVIWFVGALATLWVLERDVERAALRPVPLTPTEAQPRLRSADILRTVGAGLALGLVVALLLGDLSCSSPHNRATTLSGGQGGGSGQSSQLGRVPLPPPSAGGPVIPNPPGRTYEADGDRVIAHDPDGSTTTYDRDEQGRQRARVDDSSGTRTYVYEQKSDGTHITEYDENGDVVGRYLYDSQGQTSSQSGSATGGSSAPAQTAKPADRSASPGWLWLVGGLLVLVALAVVAALLWRRRGHERIELDWAHRAAARLDDEGHRRGRGRNRGETVVDHAAALVDGPLPDQRLTAAAQIVSAALFGRRSPDDATRAWVDQVIDEATEANPPPRRGRDKADAARW